MASCIITSPNALTRSPCPQARSKHDVVVKLPAACQLSYGPDSSPAVLSLIDRVPVELWGARLALQVAIAAAVVYTVPIAVLQLHFQPGV
jgi:hypothetical protein